INSYFISAGLKCDGVTQAGIGTNAHEYGHALGIKDLYDTNGGSEGLGHWGLMSSGNWNDQEHPAHMTAWTKERLGWLNYFIATSDQEELCLPPVETHPVAVRLWTHGGVTDEYFLVENRQPIGFDDNVHGRGLVIYHIDEDVYDLKDGTNTVNADETHKAIDVECADAFSAEHDFNADDLDAGNNRGDSGDRWCPDTQTAFNSASVPDSRSYSDSDTDVAVLNIDSCGDAEGWICADYVIGQPSQGNLCMHDCPGDGCAEITNCSQWWGSPDLWIDNDDNGTDDLPADGIDNHLWFRVENIGGTTLSDVAVELYYADPAMGQLWPSTGTLIDSKTIPVMNDGDIIEDYVVFEYPMAPEFVDHYCIGAVAVHGADPQNSEWPPNDNNVAQVNHQVLVSRAEGLLTQTGCGDFNKRSKIYLYCGGDPEDYAFAEVRLGSPPDYENYQIPEGWEIEFDPGPYELACEPGGGPADSVWVTMIGNNTEHGDQAYVPLTLFDLQTDRPIGGMIMEYRVDCIQPTAPVDNEGTCYFLHPDDMDGPTVQITWSRVTQDEGGNPESVEYYEIHRSDNQGNPEMMVDQVAVDAEPGMPGMQWYDYVVVDEGYVYTYRVRPVDGAGTPGPYSEPIVVECTVSSAGETPVDAGRRASIQPNPFRGAATLSFHLAERGPVTVDVYNVQGQRVRRLVDQAVRGPGQWSVEWDGRTDLGEAVPTGIYMYRFTSGDVEVVGRMTLIK
ncbi:MAG: T9SS type A sorting domain-containing protein, partial [Candidatus Eisenbacteria bacterium]|nr:T9SS type A sorting domain-containing protein [Candidatus Eisenbacteria bacterium]